SHLYKGRVVTRLLFKEPVTLESIPSFEDMHFYKKQLRQVLANCGHINPEVLEEYIAVGGYSAMGKALTEMSQELVVAEVKKSGLRGRGGGGFPTGMKWEFAKNAPGSQKYVVCNADEGDPGAFMDRSVLEGDPHRVLEGMAICGYAIGASEGYIYVRAEYPLAIKRLKIAIKQAEDMGLLGDNILGTKFSFHLKIKEGAGAFVCGEETALLQSIEGKRGTPRSRPPFPAISGLWGKPTNINNVETFANIPHIITNGADWYAAIGTEKSKGTKVFALTGKINNTGLAEVPMGITMREIIFEIGGGIPDGKKFKAVQIGGPSGGCLPASAADMPIDFEALRQAGTMMGSGGLIVLDETDCMVDIAHYFLSFTQSQSCGRCTFCRIGTRRMLEILDKIRNGHGTEADLKNLEKLAVSTSRGSICGLGKTAPNPVLTTLHYFRDEYEAHLEGHCPSGKCLPLIHYEVNSTCIGCTKCAQRCPSEAIAYKPYEIHSIDTEKCIKCDICRQICPVNAITVQ
ncbi:MAG: NADH-ubiquinone oxidoreductase-F iron-sulfur binding region domain-containing protein, partial [Betaproteobacteria bacterium]